jgi:alpha/beta superfamily hydrolase
MVPTIYRTAEAFKANCPSPCDIAIIPDSDHFYAGAEERVTKTVTEWLSRTKGVQ